MNYDLDKFGLSEEELFSPVDNSSLWSLRKLRLRDIPTGIPCSAYFLRKKSILPYFASWV